MPACTPTAPPGTSRFIVLTGGPGSGKTTLIEALRRLGLATAPETGRAIIREQVAIAGPALPWVPRTGRQRPGDSERHHAAVRIPR